MMASRLAITCHGVRKRFGNVEAVRGVDLSVDPGQLVALLGPSGCGKTSTLRLLAGFERPDAGEILIGDLTVSGPHVHLAPERRRVGMVFQDYALFPHMTVAKNVAYGLPRGRARRRRVAEMLELVGLTGLEHRHPHELSGGQQQRVALARALAPEPEVVLLDEPLSSQDSALRARVRDEMRDILKRTGTTAIHVTHDQEEALSIADVVAVMWDGRIVQTGIPEEIYANPATPQIASFVGDANLLSGEADGSRVRCELGTLPCRNSSTRSGNVSLLLRPEWIEMNGADTGEGTQATVVAHAFYGHDQIVEVRLRSGRCIKVRTLTPDRPEIGSEVRLRVGREVVTYACPVVESVRRP
jgi:iron(III) transport system ATP-binding protein